VIEYPGRRKELSGLARRSAKRGGGPLLHRPRATVGKPTFAQCCRRRLPRDSVSLTLLTGGPLLHRPRASAAKPPFGGEPRVPSEVNCGYRTHQRSALPSRSVINSFGNCLAPIGACNPRTSSMSYVVAESPTGRTLA
jgi:hypothetical protein